MINIYRRVIIERLGDEQGGFRRGRGCVDQVSSLGIFNENYLEKCKNLHIAFMGMEKVHDRVDWNAFWVVLR